MAKCWVKHGNRNVDIDILSSCCKGTKTSCGLEILSNKGRVFIQWHATGVAMTLKKVKRMEKPGTIRVLGCTFGSFIHASSAPTTSSRE